MDERMAREIEREAADALLNVGISIPLKEIRVPLRRRPLRLRVTLRRPMMSGQIRFARTYLSMGITSEELEGLTKDGQMRFMAAHGGKVCRMLAEAVCTGMFRQLLRRPVGWMLCHCVEQRYLVGAIQRFVGLMGTDPFISIIRLAERTNPMKPRLSREAKGS